MTQLGIENGIKSREEKIADLEEAHSFFNGWVKYVLWDFIFQDRNLNKSEKDIKFMRVQENLLDYIKKVRLDGGVIDMSDLVRILEISQNQLLFKPDYYIYNGYESIVLFFNSYMPLKDDEGYKYLLD